MHIPTIYSEEYSGQEVFEMTKEKSHHLFNVLRSRNSSTVYISNGKGLLAEGVIQEPNNVLIHTVYEKKRKKDINFFLSKLDSVTRMRFSIEKLSELGVSSITVGSTIRSGKKKYDTNKLKSWGVAALEQSGSAFLPIIYQVEKLDYLKFDQCIDINGKSVFKEDSVGNFAIGPEGGWESSELVQFKEVYSLGSQVLRSETAAIVAATLLLGA